MTVEADSVPSGGRYLTVNETRQFIGSSFEVTYYNGTEYVTTTATYDSSVGFLSETSENPSGFFSGSSWLRYRITATNINSSPAYVTVHCEPSYSLFDTEYIYTCFALSKSTNLGISSQAYQSPNSDWYIGGSNVNFANHNETATNSGSYAYLTLDNNAQCAYIPIVHRSQSTFSAYSIDAEFSGGFTSLLSFYVMCPYVSDNASGASGTFSSSEAPVTTASGSGSQSVDLTETNGLLGRIEIILSGIVDGIKGLFIPDDEFLSDWVDDMKQLLEDHLGGLYQSVTLSITFMQQFPNAVAKQSIFIPACSVPLAGSTFTLGPYTVPLKVDGLPAALYDGIAYIIDFLASMAFLKMCRNKLEIFLNPDSEVVQSDH